MSEITSINHEDFCKKKYLQKDDIIIFENIQIEHDGYDKYGPESNLYDYLLVIRRDNKILYEIFHREYWYRGEDDEEYYIFHFNCQVKPYVPFVKNVIIRLGDYEHYSVKDINKLKKHNRNMMCHKEMVQYLLECKVIYEWWSDKKLIKDLKNKKNLDLSIITDRLLCNNIIYN